MDWGDRWQWDRVLVRRFQLVQVRVIFLRVGNMPEVNLQRLVQGLLELLGILLLRLTLLIPLLRLLRLFPKIQDVNCRIREIGKIQLILLFVIGLVLFGLLADRQRRVLTE